MIAVPPPQPTQTEKLAIEQLHNEMAEIEGQIAKFEAEFTKSHPGWTVNLRTGEITAIPEPKPEVKPEVKK